MKKYYHRHPSYSNYPVVNISIEQAKAYCKWLEGEILNNEKFLFDSLSVFIPTEHEWELAARGGHDYTLFPWGHPYTGDRNGKFVANFLRIPTNDVVWQNGKLYLKTDPNEWPGDASSIPT